MVFQCVSSLALNQFWRSQSFSGLICMFGPPSLEDGPKSVPPIHLYTKNPTVRISKATYFSEPTVSKHAKINHKSWILCWWNLHFCWSKHRKISNFANKLGQLGHHNLQVPCFPALSFPRRSAWPWWAQRRKPWWVLNMDLALGLMVLLNGEMTL